MNGHGARVPGQRNVCASLFAVLLFSVRADGHELSIDELRLWVPPSGSTVLGQLTFDPELTRSLDDELSEERRRQDVSDFVRAELRLTINGAACSADVEVRELYVRGGAVPGDVVMLKCPLRGTLSHLEVTTGPRLPALWVQVSGLRSEHGGDSLIIQSEGAGSFRSVVSSSPPGASSITDANVAPTHSETPPRRTSEAWWSTAASFVALGARHVWPEGVDHVAFVAALSLSNYAEWRRLFVLLAMFTLAHTCAMAWIAVGLAAPPAAFVEPLIAATIAVAGLSGAFNWFSEPRPRLAKRAGGRPTDATTSPSVSPFLVFTFGLIHGLGFAQALAQLGEGDYILRLVSFNVGVEGAQLACAALVVLFLAVLSRYLPVSLIAALANLAIGAFGLVWTVQRLWF